MVNYNLQAKFMHSWEANPNYSMMPMESALTQMVKDGVLTNAEYEQLLKTSTFGFGFNSEMGDTVNFGGRNPVETYQASPSGNIITKKDKPFGEQIWNNTFINISNLPVNYQIIPGEYTILSANDLQAFSHLYEIFNDGNKKFEQQLKNEGLISDTVNAWRELINANATREEVLELLSKTRSDIELLDAAMRGALVDGDGNNIDFKTAFKNLRGVEFSKEKIEDCQKKSEIYARANMLHTGMNNLINNLKKYSYGSADLQYAKEFNKNALKTFQMLGLTDQGEINEALKIIGEELGIEIELVKQGAKGKDYYNQDFAIQFKNKDGKFIPLTPEASRTIADNLISKIDTTKKTLLGLPLDTSDKDVETHLKQLKNDYENSFKEAYGDKDLSILTEEYILKQEKGLMNVNLVTNIALIATSIFTGGTTAAVMTGLLITQPLQAIEMFSDENGTFGTDLLSYGKMILSQLPWLGIGMAMGKVGDLARSFIKLKGLQSLAANAGQSLDDFIKALSEVGKVPDDIANALKITRGIADASGMSIEVALDMTVTKMLQPEGATTQDWIMSFVGALAGSSLNKNIADFTNTKDVRTKQLQETFPDLKLSAEEANKIISKIDEMVANGDWQKATAKSADKSTSKNETTNAETKTESKMELDENLKSKNETATKPARDNNLPVKPIVYEIDFDALADAGYVHPYKIKFSDIEYEIVEYSKDKSGEIILKTKTGEKIYLDELNRPTKIIGGLKTRKFTYESDASKDPNLIEHWDYNNQILATIKLSEAQTLAFDYYNGEVTIKDNLTGEITKRNLDQSEYPTNINEKSKFYKNVSDEAQNCKTIDEIKQIQDFYAAKGFSVEQALEKKAINIISKEIDNCKTVEEIIQIQNFYKTKGYHLSYMFEHKIKQIILLEVENCKTINEVKQAHDFYKTKNLQIGDKIFYDKIAKLTVEEASNCKTINDFKQLLDLYKKEYSSHLYIVEDKMRTFMINDFTRCETIDALKLLKTQYESINVEVPEFLYNTRINELLKPEINKCKNLDELNQFKENYLKKDITISDEIYLKRQNEIIKIEITNCYKIELLIKFKNDYISKGINIPDEIYNDKLYETILSDIKSCKTTEEIKSLQNKYKSLGLNISEKIFNYYTKKITNPTLTDAELKIKEGNKSIFKRFQKQEFNPNDSKYLENIPQVCREIQTRIENDTGVLNEEHISNIASSISQEMKIPENEVLEVMSRLTQFGSMKKLKNLGTELGKYKIYKLFSETEISTNSAFNYFIKKYQLKLEDPVFSLTEGFILDDSSLKYLESLSAQEIDKFYQKVKKGKIVLFELDGTNLKIGDNYYSYTMLDGGQNLKAMTEAVIQQMQAGKTLDEVLQSDIRQRLNNVFKDIEDGENFADSHIKTISAKEPATVENITSQIKPSLPDADYIEKVISTVIEHSGLTDAEKPMARSVIAKYYDYMCKVYSPDSFGEMLKTMHQYIEQKVLQLGKTMDDVVYIYPEARKSFDLVCLQYAKVNGIDPNKITFYNGTSKNPELNGKVIVLLDDVVGSGESMLSSRFHYDQFLSNQSDDTNILFSPITCANNGKGKITGKIESYSRIGKDFLVYNSSQTSSYSDFISLLTPEEKRILEKVIGHKGYSSAGNDYSALATGFHYMIPDNNSDLGGYLNLIILNDSSKFDSNKTSSYSNRTGEVLRNYLKNRS